MMTTRRHRAVAVAQAAPQQRQTVLWIIAILMAIIATALIVRPDTSFLPTANANPSMLGARGIFAFTGQLDENSYGLFMMDVDSSNVWVYQYQPGRQQLKLVAARSFLYDRYLEEHKNDPATAPSVIKGMLEDQRRTKARLSGGGVAATRADTPLHTDMPGAVDVFQDNGQTNSPVGTMTPDPAG